MVCRSAQLTEMVYAHEDSRMRNAVVKFMLVCCLAMLVSSRVVAQSEGTLRSKISQLFIFGAGDEPLHLGGTADPNNPVSIQAHGDHFVPSAVAENGNLISFITSAISTRIGNVPIASTSGGVTFRFEGGIPVKTSLSLGPIFAERAQTLGRGRAAVGIGHTAFHFSSLRGVPMDNISLIFTHQNVDFPGCSTPTSDCSKMGIPTLENEIMPFRLNLDLDVAVTTLYATVGMFDHVDIGLIVPLVSTSLYGESNAQIIPFGPPPAVHFFGGTPDNPVLSASRTVNGSAFGLGDVAARIKVGLRETDNSGVALLGEARFGTGSPDDLLGSGAFSARGFVIVSGRVDSFSPHLNLGYAYHPRTAERSWNDAVLATIGFDQLVSDRVTIAAEAIGELQVGKSALELPGPVTFDAPYHRVIDPTTIPNSRDDIFNGSFGGRAVLWPGWSLVLNAIVPLNRGGMRSNIVYSSGLEISF
jgi:hypothetical protein